MTKKAKSSIIAVLLLILLFASSCSLPGISVIASERSPDGKYAVYFIETKSAAVFGPQQVKIILFSLSGIEIFETLLFNDGKALDSGNWTVQWQDTCVYITLHGEEQADEITALYFPKKKD